MEQLETYGSTMGERIELAEGQRTSGHHALTGAQRLYLPFKRFFSIILSLVGIVISIPLVLVVAIAIKLESEGPVFYNQTRIGKNGKPFLMFKFRSMYFNAENKIEELYEKNEMESVMFKMKDDPRITKVGRWIRKTSIDELPQLINILMGQMSIVGPRPVLPIEYNECSQEQRACLSSITPGLTCHWQINGRNNITSFDERIRLDMKYIEDMSPVTDILILVKTIPVVISGDGAY